MVHRLTPAEIAYRKAEKANHPNQNGFDEILSKRLSEHGAGESYRNRPDKLQSRVKTKVGLLPDRIKQLIRDVNLLHDPRRDRNHFASDRWCAAWRELLDIGEGTTLEEAYTFSPSPSASTDKNHGPISFSAPAEFGTRLGDMLAKMLVVPDGMDIEDLWADLLWGIMYGLCFPGPHGKQAGYRVLSPTERELGETGLLSERHASLDDLLEQVKQRGRTRTAQDVHWRWNRHHATASGYRALEDANERIRAILKENGVTPSHYIVWYLSKVLVQHNIRREDGKDEREAADRWVTENAVMNAVNENLLVERQVLSDRVAHDLYLDIHLPLPENRGRFSQLEKLYLETSRGTISCFDVLENFLLDEPVSRDGLAEGFEDKSSCAKFGFYLAKEIDIDGDWLPGPPLVAAEGSLENWLSASWQLTPYGRFVYCVTNNQYSLDPNDKEIATELVEDAHQDLQRYEANHC